jgi:transglutaminase-like putative cysteine protease
MDETRYLQPDTFIDSDASSVVLFAREAVATGRDDRERIILLYNKVRDGVLYDAYVDFFDPASYRASTVLAQGRGFCVGKAALLSAGARAVGIPARVGYADVRNHMTSPRLREMIKTDVFMWHSYSEIFLDGQWVKATPAFNSTLCDRLGLRVLEFDGRSDSLFQPFDRSGRRHMEYLLHRGAFADVPFENITCDFSLHYPALGTLHKGGGDFQQEAVTGDG